MQVALCGCGTVAAIHATCLAGAGARISAVCGSTLDKAQAFAAAHGIERAEADLGSAFDGADVAVIASPSALHFQHARLALERGLHVLVELPPCDSLRECRELERLALSSRRVLASCHTSRYLEPYRRISGWLREGSLGEIRQIHYLRGIVPLRRTWVDDALWHHAAHPIDLLLSWFGRLETLAAAALPVEPPYADVDLLIRLPNGAPVTVAVSYTSRKPTSQLVLFGAGHTVVTDGFSFIDSDVPALVWRGESAAIYNHAIADQDAAFLEACRTGSGAVAWDETARMIEYMETIRQLCRS